MINGTPLNLTPQFLAEATEGFATDITGASDIQGGGEGEGGDAFGRLDYFCILRDRDLKFWGLVDFGVGHVIG